MGAVEGWLGAVEGCLVFELFFFSRERMLAAVQDAVSAGWKWIYEHVHEELHSIVVFLGVSYKCAHLFTHYEYALNLMIINP